MPANNSSTSNLHFGFGPQVANYPPIRHITQSSVTNIVAKSALNLIEKGGSEYTIQASPTSVNPLISGNKQPGISKLTWLKGRNKCNIFIGETLTKAGWSMPMYKMADGSYHYVNAENLVKYSSNFHILQNKKDIRPGDIMVIDYKFAQSENGAHAEIVTECNPSKNILQTAGAHKDGAYLKDNSGVLKKIGNNLSTDNFLVNTCANVYFLRPKQALYTCP